MAVSDSTIFMLVVVFLNHMLIYNRSKLLGSIFYIVIGIATYYFVQDQPWGQLIAFIGLIGAVYAILFPKKKKNA